MDYLKKEAFAPDFRNIVKTANNQWVDRIPLYEHGIGDGIMQEIAGIRPQEKMWRGSLKEQEEGCREFWEFWRGMGYDTASMEFQITGILIGGGALGAHKEGCIKTREDFEKYPWEELPVRFFETYRSLMELFEKTRPQGMKAIGGVGNGIFECVQDLVGYMDLCYIKADDEELYEDLFKKMGEIHFQIWNTFLEKYSDAFCLMRFGDDLGFNSSTLISHEDIRNLVLPGYRRIVDRVHQAGKPFLLHSCGNLFEIFDELITATGIDAKHSNEDQIGHFSLWVERYGDRIANFGGIDTDVVCRASKEEIRDYVLDCLEKVKGHGGIAFGSGNSIPDYVSVDGYMTMVGTVRTWRGE